MATPQHSAAFLAALLEDLPQGIMVLVPPDGRLCVVNARAREMLGVTDLSPESAALDLDQWLLTRPDGRPYQRNDMPGLRVLREGERIVDETLLVQGTDGTRRRVQLRGAPVHDGDEIIAAVLVINDVSADHQQVQSAQRQARLLQDIVDHSDYLVFVKDLDSRFLLVNQPLADFLGTSPQAMIGRTDFDLLPHDRAKRFQADDACVINSGQGLVFDEMHHVGGRDRIMRAHKFPLRETDGKIYALCAMIEDVTEQRAIERQMAAREEHWRRLLDELPLAVVGHDQNGAIAYVNPAMLQTLGHIENDILGRRLESLTRPALSDQHEQAPSGMELRWLRTASGEEQLLAWSHSAQDLADADIVSLSLALPHRLAAKPRNEGSSDFSLAFDEQGYCLGWQGQVPAEFDGRGRELIGRTLAELLEQPAPGTNTAPSDLVFDEQFHQQLSGALAQLAAPLGNMRLLMSGLAEQAETLRGQLDGGEVDREALAQLFETIVQHNAWAAEQSDDSAAVIAALDASSQRARRGVEATASSVFHTVAASHWHLAEACGVELALDVVPGLPATRHASALARALHHLIDRYLQMGADMQARQQLSLRARRGPQRLAIDLRLLPLSASDDEEPPAAIRRLDPERELMLARTLIEQTLGGRLREVQESERGVAVHISLPVETPSGKSG